jgi:hypothetical protein
MSALLLEWVDSALALEEENRELRAIIAGLVLAIYRNRPLIEFARGQLDAADFAPDPKGEAARA